jgi:hypothetical protein
LTSPLTFVSAIGSLVLIFFSAAAAGAAPFVGFALVIGAFLPAMVAFGSVFDTRGFLAVGPVVVLGDAAAGLVVVLEAVDEAVGLVTDLDGVAVVDLVAAGLAVVELVTLVDRVVALVVVIEEWTSLNLRGQT